MSKNKEENAPNYAKMIGDTAMELFAEHGEAVAYVRMAPFVYPFIVEATQQQIDFQVLYGHKPLEMYGLTLKCYPTDFSGQPWSPEKPFELITQALIQPQEINQVDSLAVKIVKTWESCQSQCQEGFPCPLLAEVGVNLDGEVMDACTALRDIESLMGANESALDGATTKFRNDNGT